MKRRHQTSENDAFRATAAIDPEHVGVFIGQAVGDLKAAKVDSEGIPTSLVVFPYPTYETDDGVLVTDDESQRSIVWWFRKRNVSIVIDWEHQTCTGEVAPAAGWINAIVAGGKAGLLAEDLDWSRQAEEYIQTDRYRYHSPVYYYDKRTRRIFRLHSLALTNSPKSHNQKTLVEQVAAKAMQDYEIEYAKAAAVGSAAGGKGGATMSKLKGELLERFRYLTETRLDETYKVMKQRAQILVDLIPDTDDVIAAEEADKAGGSEAASTIADLLEIELPAAPVADSAVFEALDLDAKATVAQVVAKIVALQEPEAAAGAATLKADLKTARAEIAKLKAGAITPEKLFEAKLASAKGIPPARVARLRAIAKEKGFEFAAAVLDELPSEKPARVDAAPSTEHEISVASLTTRVVGATEYEISEDSAAKTAEVEAYMRDKSLTNFAQAADKLAQDKALAARR
jgi:hypothetical protein